MREGTLVYSLFAKRMDIRFAQEDYYGGLHCGECFDVLLNGKWIPTRIEYGDDWFLVGLDRDKKLSGLKVRMENTIY